MIRSFNRAFEHLMRYEGRFSDVKGDRGGRTKYGITETEYQKDFPGFNIENVSDLQAKEWYYRRYWLAMKLDQVNLPTVAAELFEQAVNMPWGQAVKHAQQAVNMLGAEVDVDGLMGPKTIEAINTCRYPEPLLRLLNGLQVCWYIDIVRRNPDQKMFLRGWLRRVEI